MGKKAFYAVARGRSVGVYRTWPECKAQVDGFVSARFKKFESREEADAFIAANSNAPPSSSGQAKPFFTDQTKRKRANGEAFNEQAKRFKGSIPDDIPVVYTDGACSQNGKANARAGWGVFWGQGHEDNACGPVTGAATNNRGELEAVAVALGQAIKKKIPSILVRTDSQLLIQSMDIWIHKWKKNGWKTGSGEVKNVDLLQDIDRKRSQIKVYFEYVPGHAGVEGNERADELARDGAKMYGKDA